MDITCSVGFPDYGEPQRYSFIVGEPSPTEVVGQRMHLIYIDRSDGVQLKAYGFDLLDVYESALQVIRMNVASLAGTTGNIIWY